jgi:hypothetical protein
MSGSSSLPFRYSMYRLSRRSSVEELGKGSIAKPSSAASLKSSLGFIADSFDTFSPSATTGLTVSSAAFPYFSIRPSPIFVGYCVRTGNLVDPLSIGTPGPFGKIKMKVRISTRLRKNYGDCDFFAAGRALAAKRLQIIAQGLSLAEALGYADHLTQGLKPWAVMYSRFAAKVRHVPTGRDVFLTHSGLESFRGWLPSFCP